jgi:hypothetical protein
MFTIQWTPNRSVSMPNVSPRNCFSNGMVMVPFSARSSNAFLSRSASVPPRLSETLSPNVTLSRRRIGGHQHDAVGPGDAAAQGLHQRGTC